MEGSDAEGIHPPSQAIPSITHPRHLPPKGVSGTWPRVAGREIYLLSPSFFAYMGLKVSNTMYGINLN